jgi:hypothetical protein
MTPNNRAAVAVSPFPVPRSLAGNTSGEAAYNTPNMIWKKEGARVNLKEGKVVVSNV